MLIIHQIYSMKALISLNRLEKKCLRLLNRQYFSSGDPKINKNATANFKSATSPSSQQPQASSNHANSLQELSNEVQQAMWASKIVRSIRVAQQPTKLTDQSLREKLIKLDLKIDGYQLKDQCREACLKFFTDGVYLNSKVYNQTRVNDGKQLDTGQSNPPFIFCPNVAVTKQIFNLLLMAQKSYLISGGYGISKTISMILLCQLSKIIHIFLYKALMPAKEGQINQYFIELQKLMPYIEHDFPRFWYWTIDKQKINEQQFDLPQIMIQQAVELSSEDKEELRKIKKFKQFKTTLRNKYPKGTKHRAIVDQINYIAKFGRVWNYTVDRFKLKYKISSGVLQEDVLKFASQKEIDSQICFNRAKQQIHQYTRLGDIYVLNSSVNFEESLIHVDKKQSAKVNLMMEGQHKSIQRKQLEFHNKLLSEWARIDYYHFFWFQIQRILMQKIDKQTIIKVQQQFYKIAKDHEIKGYYRMLIIRQFLIKKEFFKETSNNINDLVDKIKILMSTFKGYCIKESVSKLKNWNDKQEDVQSTAKRNVLTDILYTQAVKNHYTGIKDMKFQFEYLNKFMPEGHDIRYFLLSDEANKEYMPLSIKQDEVTFHWTPSEFIEIAGPTLYPEMTQFYSRLSTDDLKKFFLENHQSKGQMLQFRIRQLLIPDTTCIFTYKGKKETDPNQSQLKINEQLNFFAQTTFIHFHHKLKKKSIELNLKQALQKAREHPMSVITSVPNIIKGDWSSTSPSIDFLFVMCNPLNTPKFSIWSFDITVGQLPHAKIPKTKLFLQNLIAISAHPEQYMINHIIICSSLKIQQLEKKVGSINKQVQISFGLLQDFHFMSKLGKRRNIQEYKLFKQLVINMGKEVKKKK